jgi:Trk K+ transport system NAD-binding subunit
MQYGIAYHWVGAFSKDDAANLLICLSAKRKNSDIRTMAKCNNVIFENIFRHTGITVILQNDMSASRILACLRG